MVSRYGWLLVAFGFGCTPRAEPSKDDAASSARPRYGAVMIDVGRRFELAGKAASANRFELAAFEVGEIQESFGEDLPNAELPKEGNPQALPAMQRAFLETNAPELVKAAQNKDAHAFGDAFARAAAACNACHQSSGHGFIEIPTTPGQPVPSVSPR